MNETIDVEMRNLCSHVLRIRNSGKPLLFSGLGLLSEFKTPPQLRQTRPARMSNVAAIVAPCIMLHADPAPSYRRRKNNSVTGPAKQPDLETLYKLRLHTKMRILFICHRLPYPPHQGGKIRPFN